MEDKTKNEDGSKQIRVESELHRALKTYASKEGLTLTRMMSRISKFFFSEHNIDMERLLAEK